MYSVYISINIIIIIIIKMIQQILALGNVHGSYL